MIMSPELNGLTAPRYHDFRAGNIHHQPLAQIITHAGQLRYVREYATGLARCARECSFCPFIRKDRHMAENTQPTPTEDILARLAGDAGREQWHQETFRDFADGRRNTTSGR
jgi:hypothetical protein